MMNVTSRSLQSSASSQAVTKGGQKRIPFRMRWRLDRMEEREEAKVGRRREGGGKLRWEGGGNRGPRKRPSGGGGNGGRL